MIEISNQVIQDLTFFDSLESETASEFCKLVLAQLSKLYLLDTNNAPIKPTIPASTGFGVSHKVLESAAKRLRVTDSEVTADMIASTLQSIAHFYVESAKQKFTPESLSTFLKDTIHRNSSILVEHYENIYDLLQNSMKNLMHSNQNGSTNSFVNYLPHYAGLEWRLDAIVSSRALPSNSIPQATPIISMKLKLRSTSANHGSVDNMESEEENSKETQILLQTDPVNLCHITDVLENALKEARSQQFRKLQRQL